MPPSSPTAASRPALPQLLALALQFALLWVVVRAYGVENAAFGRVYALASTGFLVHALLPAATRLPFFVALSLGAIGLVFGIADGLWLVGAGLVLVGIANVPLPHLARAGLLLLAGAGFAVARRGGIEGPWPMTIWPILGSMFMFRLIVYSYDRKNGSAPGGAWRSLAYFFMLPNVCFPLFPVVDYKNFCRGYLRGDLGVVYQRGMVTMARGITQLLIYRLVYQYMSTDVATIANAREAAIYLVSPYLLYLKISGSFHLVVGIMQAYGFDLPRTNHNYFLATSFTDYWRRINIYWKEFLQKIFFNPVYFRLARSLGATTSLVLATLIAFFATWALHSYQWFWIRGTFPVVWQDIAFWSVMGLVVLANMVWEAKRGRRRTLGKKKRTLRGELVLAIKTIATFTTICASWAIWSAQSFGELRVMVEKLLSPSASDLLWIGAGLAGLGVASVVFDRYEDRLRKAEEGASVPLAGRWGIRWPAVRVATVAVLLMGFAYGSLVLYYQPAVADVADRLRNPLRLSGKDAQALDRGYYEDLTDVARFNPKLAEMYRQKPPDWERCWAIHRTGGFPTHELLPERQVAFKGAMMSTNQWGMRDKDYPRAAAPGTVRVAITGASHTMGTGVEDPEGYEALLEDWLNLAGERDYELLNFAVGGYGPLARLHDLEQRMMGFEPDWVIIVGIHELHWASRELLDGLVDGAYELPWPGLVELAASWGIEPGMDPVVARSRLYPHREELLAWIYGRVREIAGAGGARVAALFLPQPREEAPEVAAELERQKAVAREGGPPGARRLRGVRSRPAR